jgi:hypothetical protein
MGGTRLLPPLADIFWIGTAQSDWHDANNWDPNVIPTYADKAAIDNNGVALISAGDAYAKELWLGIDNGGNLYQTDGSLSTEYTYIGGRADCTGGSYTLDGGSFHAKDLCVGLRKPGKFS